MALSTTFTLKFNGAAVQRGLAGVSTRVGKLASVAARVGTAFAGLGAIMSGAGIGAAMGGFVKDSSDAAASLEMLSVKMAVFTGSAEKAQEVIAALRILAAKSPLEQADIMNAATKMLQYGVAVNEVVGVTENLSEIASGNAEQFERLGYAFGQVKSMGYLLGTELRQFTEAGFNPLNEIAKKTGESMEDLRARMGDHKVTYQELADAIKAATSEGGLFYRMNEKISKTFEGRVSMMKDQWNQLIAKFGTGMNEGLKSALDAITVALPLMQKRFAEIGGFLGDGIADSVKGDNQKLIAVGAVIGEYLKIGIKTAFESIATELVGSGADIFQKYTKYNPTMQGQRYLAGKIGAQAHENTFEDIAIGNMDSPGLNAALENVRRMSGQGSRFQSPDLKTGAVKDFMVPGYNARYANANEQNSIYKDAEGNRVILDKINTGIEGLNKKLSPQP